MSNQTVSVSAKSHKPAKSKTFKAYVILHGVGRQDVWLSPDAFDALCGVAKSAAAGKVAQEARKLADADNKTLPAAAPAKSAKSDNGAASAELAAMRELVAQQTAMLTALMQGRSAEPTAPAESPAKSEAPADPIAAARELNAKSADKRAAVGA